MASVEVGSGGRSAITMHDVARHAGVSTMTVSNVINGHTTRVSAQTRARVLESMAALGYRVNLSARSLRRGKTGVIGLAVPAFGPAYFAQLAQSLVGRFAERGYRLVIEYTGGAVEQEIAALANAHLDAYDGFVLYVAAGDGPDLERLSPSKAVVLLGERTPAAFDHVQMDNVNGARMATEHLLRTGARRIALLGGRIGDAQSMAESRTRGYFEAHAQLGLEADNSLVVASDFGAEEGRQRTKRLLETTPDLDAIFAVTDAGAIGALSALHEARRRVPDDVQVIGWDDIAETEFTYPRLSSVDPDNAAIAESTVQMLLERMVGAPSTPPRVVTPAARLMLRGTTLDVA
jgi:DNA-binding LacI/PurR family transcriptional regulator